MTEVAFPYSYDERGRTASAGYAEHIRDLIEQVLFTSPGERVNRPTFGCGLAQLVHEPNSDAIAGATQVLVQGSLQQCLGALIEVESLTVASDEALLEVKLVYKLRATGERHADSFRGPGS